MKKILVVKDTDNVATCLATLPAGAQVEFDAGGTNVALQLSDAIEFGHKFAVRGIAAGERVIKYGETIGLASQDIAAGQWVHIHNVESVRARGDQAAGAST